MQVPTLNVSQKRSRDNKMYGCQVDDFRFELDVSSCGNGDYEVRCIRITDLGSADKKEIPTPGLIHVTDEPSTRLSVLNCRDRALMRVCMTTQLIASTKQTCFEFRVRHAPRSAMVKLYCDTNRVGDCVFTANRK